tara:strand:+ start:3131 stop:3580 length:450 start_codon:yes stop_codon:yes gene_type:complete
MVDSCLPNTAAYTFTGGEVGGQAIFESVHNQGGGTRKKRSSRRSVRKSSRRSAGKSARKSARKSAGRSGRGTFEERVKKSCHTECEKNRKLTIKIIRKMGKKTGLSDKEVNQKIKDYNENCEGNCVKLLKDKDIMKDILKGMKGRRKRN